MKNIVLILTFCAAVAVSAGTTVAVKSVSSDPSTGILTVSYSLSGDCAVVTLSAETNGIPIPDAAFRRVTGDVNKVVAADGGDCEIRWCPDDDFGNGVFASGGCCCCLVHP